MAATYRTSVTGGDTTGTSNRTASISALASDLLVVFVTAANNASTTPTMTDDAGGTYTLLGATVVTISSVSHTGSFFVRNSLVSANATIVITATTGSNDAGCVGVIAVSGMQRAGAGAVRQAGIAALGVTTPAVTLSKAALTTNMMLGGVLSADTTTTEPASWTERIETSQVTPTTALEVATRDSGFTSTTVTWGAAASTECIAMALELDGSPIGGDLILVGNQIITVNGTYTPTSGATLVIGELVGSGGSGGSATTTNNVGGTGGGSGEYVRFRVDGAGTPITGGAVTIGAAVSTPATAGNSTSIVINGATITGQGGGAGVTVTAAGGGHANAAPTLGASGSVAYDIMRFADRGGANLMTSTSGTFVGGNGASGLLGRGGDGGNNANVPGGAATGFGAGGGGALRGTINQVGGASAPGVIIIEEYAPMITAATIADAVWDEARSGHVTVGSFGEYTPAEQRGMVVSRNTATGGGAASITLAASESYADNLLSGLLLSIVSGTGVGQTRPISSYTNSTKVCTFGSAFTTNPTAGSVYVIWAPWYGFVSLNANAITNLTFTANAIDSNALATSAVTEIQTGLATSAAQTTAQTDLDDIQTRLPAALVSGRMDSSVGAMAAGVLTATAIASNAITAAKVATDAIGAAQLAADAVTEIQTGLATSAALATVQADTDNIQTRLPAALVSGRMDSSVGAMAADVMTAAAAAADLTTELQTGLATATNLALAQLDIDDIQSRLPASLVSGRMDSSVGAMAANVMTAAAADPTLSAEIADAVWEEALADHSGTFGSTAQALSNVSAATIADAVWDELLSGHVTAGSAGNTLAALPTAIGIDAILSSTHGAGNWEDNGGLTAAAVADAVWDELMADHDTAGTFGAGLQTLEDAVLIWPTPVGGGTTAQTIIDRAMAIADIHDNFVSAEEWLSWLNQEQYALQLFLARSGWALPFDTTTAVISADGWTLSTNGATATQVDSESGHYVFTPTLADVMAVVCIHEYQNGALKRLTYNNAVNFLRQLNGATTATGHATDYRMRMYGNEIWMDFYPTPQSGETYLITYLSAPIALTAATQSVALPMGWEERLVLGMARRALVKEESDTTEIKKLIAEMDSQIELLCWNRVMSESPTVRNSDPRLPEFPTWQNWWWL